MNRAAWLMLAVCLAGVSTGCVTRRVMITSEPPGAIVYRNGVYLGPTPVEEPFIYYGKYNYRLVRDGYEPLDVSPDLEAPWYEYPGVDFISENLIPYPFRDVQRLHYRLEREKAVRTDDLRIRGEALRQEAAAIQPTPKAPAPNRAASRSSPATTPEVAPSTGRPVLVEPTTRPDPAPATPATPTPVKPAVNGGTGPVARSPESP